VVAGAEVSGSVTIGDDTWIGPQATIRDGLTIGAGVLVGIGSVVVKNIEAGTTVKGNPARPN
jgi:acetyltransferase-like isoleucine patch superfamily enzyme